MNALEMQQHPRCECHDCTQARWKQSLEGQLARFDSFSTVTLPLVTVGKPEKENS